jgi:hypothetical protein
MPRYLLFFAHELIDFRLAVSSDQYEQVFFSYGNILGVVQFG